ncbi:RCC1/BLIP-II [Annulohypoxylon maeteangense]|uniref:RCC1/BLIP-II n=1 Tax=Annulohypoxylon maeteangense TaxID=1927788 RepID=UPI002007816A|nr:RCC1/BLIP-II [Annulohypoxylon maeteangense]KAI0885309.1 RCC1/BLIP-II [Annulohypoxylon maeteangense]
MELLATGFNAWGQLHFNNRQSRIVSEPDDIDSFQSILKDDFIGHPCSLLECTLVKTTSGIRHAGFIDANRENIKEKLLSSTAAIAGNGIIADYDGHNTICQYLSQSIGGEQEHHEFSGMEQIIQLVAYETGFAALSQDGRVWTWGDERYGDCLGRPITHSSPAGRPGLVEELEDLPTGKIVKIFASGYMVLALTEGHDLYAWGGHPGRKALLDGLSSSPMPVIVEESDIIDCGVGESHMIVLTSEHDVYVIGDNTNGQLGLPVEETRSWTRISLQLKVGQIVCGVNAGQRTSFILIKDKDP